MKTFRPVFAGVLSILVAFLAVRPALAVGVVQRAEASITSGSSTTTLTPSTTTMPAVNNYILLRVTGYGSSTATTFSASDGVNAFSQVTGGLNNTGGTGITYFDLFFCAKYATAVSGTTYSPTVTASAAQSTWTVMMIEVNGQTSCTPHEYGTINYNGTSVTSEAVTASTGSASAGDIVFDSFILYLSGTAVLGQTPPTGYTVLRTADPSGYYLNYSTGYKIVSAAETSSAAMTTTTAIPYYGAAIVSFPMGGTATCTSPGLTAAGGLAVPVAGSTVMLRADGSAGTVSCAGTTNGDMYFTGPGGVSGH